jgi:subtilisin family serine protease
MSKSPLLTLLSTAALSAVAALSVPMADAVGAPREESRAQAKKLTNNLFIVRLAELPVSAYDGSIKGLKATRVTRGQKLDPNNPAVIEYKAFLERRHDAVLAAAGGARKVYSYGYVFNGFAAELTPAQADKIARMPGVLGVVRDELRQVTTATTPNFIGISQAGGLWSQGFKGENVIIGVIDGGITPEHPSFSDRTGVNGNATKDGKLGYQQIPGWNGRCVPGERFNASDCNQKLIGAQFYNAGYGGAAGVKAVLPFEFISPRDYDGHGTHTASTAGGNENVKATGQAAFYGTISGIAPRARIAAYKVCWGIGGTPNSGCFSTDSVAAIDQAVIDGVDVINFSISGSRTNFRDPVEIAWLFAADAGVFVATSAGNSGPTESTVAHPSPWVTTVAAGTHDRNYDAVLTLGNGTTYTGASTNTAATGPAPFINSEAAGLPGADPEAVRLCFAAEDAGAPVLDPAKVSGKIVLCDRGSNARVNKSLAVAEAGGVGMVLVNTSPNSLNGDFHSVPTVHLPDTARDALKAYTAMNGATATIGKAFFAPIDAPFTASFSSRGPLLAGNGDLLKPDIIAPGQDILAGVAPYTFGGEYFGLLSGTSMSSPHIAGIAAVLKGARPSWTPAMIKSAMMTSAGDVLDGPNTDPLVLFSQGAGHVRPNSALNPGLVFNSGFADWLGFLCGTQLPTSFCTNAGVPVLDPSDLNLASIAIGDLPGEQTVKRRVTNVGATATYTVSVEGLAGMTVTVDPASFTLKAGESRNLTIKFTNRSADPNAYLGGQITWTGTNGERVRIPVVVKPVALGAPAAVASTGSAVSYDVRFGFNGPFTASARGLVAPNITAGTVVDDPTNGDCTLTSPGAVLVPVTLPAGTTYARYALFDADVSPGADIDLCVYLGDTLVGLSATGTSAEEINFAFANPLGGPIPLMVVVQGWGVAGTSPFKLHEWYVPATDAGNMTVSAPATAVIGAKGTITVTPAANLPAGRWLGSVSYSGADGMPAPTLVTVTKP